MASKAVKASVNSSSGTTEDVEMEGAEGGDTMGGIGDDVQVEMSTMMEGFRYLKNDNGMYPVFKGEPSKPCDEFPIIPVGMLAIWREYDDGDDGDFADLLGPQ